MTRTAFYAIDQEHLDARYWSLADTFAEMHALLPEAPHGVVRITSADLRLVLDCCALVPDGALMPGHEQAIARLASVLDPDVRQW